MTRAQRKAARRNARLSAGPGAPENRTAPPRKAATHEVCGSLFVLLPGEDRAAFEALAREYRDEWRPSTPHESFLVSQMAQARWRLDRFARMEAECVTAILNLPFAGNATDEGALVIADRTMPSPNALDKLRRLAEDAGRSYHRAVRELRAYRADRRKEPSAQPLEPAPAKKRNEPKPAAAAFGNEPDLDLPDSDGYIMQPRRPVAESFQASAPC